MGDLVEQDGKGGEEANLVEDTEQVREGLQPTRYVHKAELAGV